MSLGINGNLAGPALNALGNQQSQLQNAIAQASSGKRITNASIDPSGLAIYNALESQSAGFDTANGNIVDASNAVNVADGALSSTTDSLQQLSSLAIEATNSFLSSSDRAALQDQANALVQQINGTASQTNFNGQPLLTGQLSGNTPATNADATITNNSSVGAGGSLVASATASPTTQSGTISVQVVNGGATAQITFTDNATGTTTNVGTFAAGSTTSVNGTNITLGNFGPGDDSDSSTVQTTAPQAGSANPTVGVQTGANQGAVTQVAIPTGTTSGLGIANIDLSSSASATNAQGQINAALTAVGTARAQLGAQSAALGANFQNNATASVNLTASASAIGDTSEASVASELNSLAIQQQISIATINQANVDYGYLNRFFSVNA